MPIFNNVQELLKNAMGKGIISLTNLCVRVGTVNIVAQNGAIHVLKPAEWKNFLQFVVENSDHPAEINQANLFLNLFSSAETAREQQLKQLRQKTIEQLDIDLLSTRLSKVTTANDVINVVDNLLLSKLLPTIIPNGISDPVPIEQLSPPSQTQPPSPSQQAKPVFDLHWKRPMIINNKLRYYTHEIDWYIERQESRGSCGGLIIYYSIFSADNLEKARYDHLKDAKQDMLKMYKTLR